MTSESPLAGSAAAQKLAAPTIVLLKPKDAARLLKVSLSWLAKARLRGDGPRFVKIGRAVRYRDGDVQDYVRARTRTSTSQQS